MALDLNLAYNALLGLSIDLNFNDAPNPAYIQTKLIECHKASKQVEKIHTELKMEMSRSMRLLSIEEGKFEVLQREALSQNETVKRFPSYQDRVAYVGTLLETYIETIRKLKSDIEEQKNLEKALNLIIKNLSRLNSDIKAQQKLMESQMTRLNMGDMQDKDVKDLMSKLGKLSEDIDADDLKVGEAEEDETTEEEKEESVDVSSLVEPEPDKVEKVTSNSVAAPEKVIEKPAKQKEDDPLAGLLSTVADKKKKESKDHPSLKEEDTQVEVDLSASFLEDDPNDVDTDSDSEEEVKDNLEESIDELIEPEKVKVETDDLEDALAGISEEAPKKEPIKTEQKKEVKKETAKPKAKKEEKPKVKVDDASEGEINIDELLAGIT